MTTSTGPAAAHIGNSKQPGSHPAQNKNGRSVRPLFSAVTAFGSRSMAASCLFKNGFTHYLQRREEWRFFLGHTDLPSRIVVADGDGALTFYVLEWRRTQLIPLMQINWRDGAIPLSAGPAMPLIRRSLGLNVKPKPVTLAEWRSVDGS